ncbi:peptide/nickel transport system substrate-binding protein [Phyllobacterium trifolii]|uniref:Peptide/nickel transport system substrate-binding protein n=1 Tax=Phyllobacterium trifolii TaxID=300193 RepID=A0A839UJW1_9HYPH|nr:ABC transporter substrate-binding protein [Phyllobacterium trifolii]MBB3149170.1 peptide/nickel transport system substrate-binding protein [Phyllobacterium trifolii]
MLKEIDRCRSLTGIDRRRFLAGSASLGIAAAVVASTGAAFAQETPKSGGNLRIAILGGGSADTLDANSNVTQPDTARVLGLYEPLRSVRKGGVFENVLAESMEANADATEWTIRLRPDVLFHNGKKLQAEDVAFTFRRVTDPAAPLVGAPGLAPMDRDGLKIVDDLTLRVPMKTPYAIFDEVVADDINLGIVPVGYDPQKPVGTGAFKFESFSPGQQSVFMRFDDYWGEKAYLDSVTIIDSFASDNAAFYALQGGEIDAFAATPLALAKQVQEGGPIKILASEVGQWTPFTMRVDQPPFDNPDVRKAMRLVVDREQIIKIAMSGFAAPGNDVFSRWDGAPDRFKRERDIEQAKELLKKAGQENLTVDLVTADIANGVVTSAQIYARQAKDAGITVNVKQVTPEVFFGEQYLKWPFAQSFWTLKPYLPQVALCLLPNSPYNETHWSDPAYIKLYGEAIATIDPLKRADLISQLQIADFEQGGYIIPSHNRIIDLVASNVNGLSPGALLALGDYNYRKIWLS